MDKSSEKPAKQKLVANIWTKLNDAMSRKIEEACLVRDSYLDKILEAEVAKIRAEIKQPNSDAHREFIELRLSKLPRKPVSFSFRQETVSAINKVCSELNIPRDALLNRIFFLLLIRDQVWDSVLGVDDYFEYVGDLVKKNGGTYFSETAGLPLLDIIAAAVDPFWGPRLVLEAQESLHTLSEIEVNSSFFGGDISQDEKDGLIGLNCCLTNTDVDPETLESKSLDQLLGL